MWETITILLLWLTPPIAPSLNDIFFHVVSPARLSYSYQITQSTAIGVPFPSRTSKNIQLVYAYPNHACQPLKNLAIFGKVVLIERGECTFLEKVLHAEAAGAKYVIITNSAKNDHEGVDMVSDEPGKTAGISVAYLIGASGKKLRDQILYGEEDVYINIPLNYSMVQITDIPSKPPWEFW